MRKRKPENPHTKLVNDLVCALGERPELGKFWKRNTGRARHMKDPGKIIAYGFKGSGDIEGFLNNGYASHVEIEVKTGKAEQAENQILFEQMATGYGAIYILARSVDEVLEKLDHLRKMQGGNRKIWTKE